jgi:hypothetical protein
MELGLTELAALHADRMERVLLAPLTHKEQPLARILRARHHPKDRAASRVTDQAMRWLKQRGLERWLKQRLRAAESSDYAAASSALGEIRSLGQIATLGDQVVPIERGGDPTPDFDVTIGSERLVVEVKTLNMNEEEAKALKAFHESREAKERVPFPGVAVREHSTAPLGRPRDGDLLGQRVARKFFSLSDDTQADPARRSLLWIDLYDDDAWVLSADAFAPVVMHHGQFFSVGGWHGFYGLPDTPLFERDEPQWGVLREARLLGFDGRLASGANWAAGRDPAGADGGLGVRVVVSLVETEVLGTARATRRAEDHRVEHLAHEPLVVDVGASDFCGQRNAPSVGQNVAFDATFRAVGRVGAREVPPFGAFTMALSSDDHFHWMPRLRS